MNEKENIGMRKKTMIILIIVLFMGLCVFSPYISNREVLAADSESGQSVILLDQDGIYVEYRGIVEHSSSSWIINLYVENNRDSDFYLSLRNVLINGCKISISNNGGTIQSGSKYLAEPNFDLVLGTDDLSAYGISEITDVSFDVRVATEMFGDELLTTSVLLENINKSFDGEIQEITPGKVVLNQDNMYVEYLGIDEYSSQSWIINMYVENNRDNEIYFSLSDTLINGFSFKLSNNGVTIPAHSKYLASPNFDLIIDTEDLEAYGVDSIETLASTLSIRTSMLGDTIAEIPVDLSSAEPDATKAENSIEVQEDATEATSSEEESTEAAQEEAITDFTEIKKGDNNESVVEVQQILIKTGYLTGIADGVFGGMTEQSVKDFQTSNGIEATGIVNAETYSLLLQKKDEIATANMPEGLSLDEDKWNAWESTNVCSLFPFMDAAEKAGFTFSLPSGQQENHKEGIFDFKDDGSIHTLDQTTFYYGVENQQVFYVGLNTDNESTYYSDDFREACIRLMLGYNIHYDNNADEAVLNLTRGRAEEIVNYCFDNDVKHCVVDNMRIRLIRNDNNDNYFSFHIEY